MAVGFVHIPSLIVGTFVCASFYRPKVGRVVTRVLGVALVGALVYHVAAQMTGHEEHWFYLAMVTVDIAILFTIGLFMTGAPRAARQGSPDGRGARRHW